jgi:GMP synthase-like glutamine amidotransferase
MRALILQHIPCEPPGHYEDVLVERGATIHRVELDQGKPLPDWRAFDLIIAMGGPMSVNDDRKLPWLTGEKRAIGEAVRAGVPYWGACLGAQLLAASLGARVYAGPRPEIGVLPVELTEAAKADPVFRELPAELFTLQWHGDTFDLPEGAVLLAGSAACAHQAFRWGRRAYGVQFHIEVSVDMVCEWAKIPEYRDYLERELGAEALPQQIARLAALAEEMRGHSRAMFGRWLDMTGE